MFETFIHTARSEPQGEIYSHVKHIPLTIGINMKNYINNSIDLLKVFLPTLAIQSIREYNAMVLRGDIERARAAIRSEFVKNRKLAYKYYEKYKGDMSKEVRVIYEEFIGG